MDDGCGMNDQSLQRQKLEKLKARVASTCYPDGALFATLSVDLLLYIAETLTGMQETLQDGERQP